MSVACFVDAHVVATPPDLTYHSGGNLVELDYLAWMCRDGTVYPTAYEDVSSGHENLEKQFRHHFAIKRRIPVVYFKGKNTVSKRGLETAGPLCGEDREEAGPVCKRGLETAATDKELCWGVDEDYRKAVRHAYLHFPDLAHINYFILNASPSYMERLAADLLEAGKILTLGDPPTEANHLEDYYRFLGAYLREKAKALLDEVKGTCTATTPTPGPLPCAQTASLEPPVVVFIQQTTEDAEVMSLPYLITAHTYVSGTCGNPTHQVSIVDRAVTVGRERRPLDVNMDVLGHYICRDDSTPFKSIIVGDYDKDKVDKFIERSVEEHMCINVLYVPKYAYLVVEEDKAPTARTLIVGNSKDSIENLAEKFVAGRRLKEIYDEVKSLWGRDVEVMVNQAKTYGVPPFPVVICSGE